MSSSERTSPSNASSATLVYHAPSQVSDATGYNGVSDSFSNLSRSPVQKPPRRTVSWQGSLPSLSLDDTESPQTQHMPLSPIAFQWETGAVRKELAAAHGQRDATVHIPRAVF